MIGSGQLLSGAIHYFRVDPSLWRDRLMRLQALGLTSVETYVPWNFHERRPGEIDFTGPRDLGGFIDLAGSLGLEMIVRPGPYICAEWDFGGLPAWLLTKPMALRTADPAYLHHVEDWLDAVVPVLLPRLATAGGPVVAVQIENEFGSFGDDQSYLSQLHDGLRDRGIDVRLFTADGGGEDYLANGTLPGVFATGTFGSRVDESVASLRAVQPAGPDICMEFWDGWFDHWGEPHHTRDATEAAAVLAELLGRGAGVNLYMAHGGTNFGLWNGANQTDEGRFQPTVTSYDYDAPIGEAGDLGPKFWAFREVITQHTGVQPPEPPPLPARLVPQSVPMTEWASLLGHLDLFDAPILAPHPAWMEDLGIDHGLMHYRAEAYVPDAGGDLTLVDLRDRATVLIDGAVVATVDRNDPQPVPLAPGAPGRYAIEVVVENQGRTNFGPGLGERKGLGGVRLGQRWIHSWSSRALPIDRPGWTAEVLFGPDRPESRTGPQLARGYLEVSAPADGFVALPGWGKGFCWLNGQLLGRYWSVGPQATLYAPAAWWRTGINEIVVLEMLAAGEQVEVRDAPELAATGTAS